ncbi:hypothetical protein Bbelb_415340 [Branchiostoma belcheri]|nr:hypothetical protein Bbelb_415340 [Branchiostoma belcheri]
MRTTGPGSLRQRTLSFVIEGRVSITRKGGRCDGAHVMALGRPNEGSVGTPAQKIVFDRKRNPPDDQANNVTRDHDIRLLGASVFEGRVQIKRDGMWGSLCLSSGSWRNSEATVVCRQLGFAEGRVENKYLTGKGRMAMCDLDCRGNENNIYECDHDDLDLPPECPYTFHDSTASLREGSTLVGSPSSTAMLAGVTKGHNPPEHNHGHHVSHGGIVPHTWTQMGQARKGQTR